MIDSDVKQIVDKANKLPRGQDLAYMDDIIRDLQVERADLMIKRLNDTSMDE